MRRRILPLVLLCLAPGLRLPPRAADLAVVDAYFEDYDRMLVRQQRLTAGDTLYLTFRITGFQTDKTDNRDQVRLAYWIDCLDPQNVPLTETLNQKIEEKLRGQDANWRPKINWSLVIPSHAPSGEYRVNIRVRDEIASQEVRHRMNFRVRGETVEPSATLTVRNFQFADTEQGVPKPTATYLPGSTLWARFWVVGFRIGPEKQIWVEEDLAVLDEEGKVLYAKPRALVEKHRLFYPPRFVHATFSLNLEAQLRPGDYTIRLDVRDLLSEQTTRHEAKFTVTK